MSQSVSVISRVEMSLDLQNKVLSLISWFTTVTYQTLIQPTIYSIITPYTIRVITNILYSFMHQGVLYTVVSVPTSIASTIMGTPTTIVQYESPMTEEEFRRKYPNAGALGGAIYTYTPQQSTPSQPTTPTRRYGTPV